MHNGSRRGGQDRHDEAKLRALIDVRRWLQGPGPDKVIPRLTLGDRCVLLLIASYMRPDGTNAYPGAERLGQTLGMRPDNVENCTRRLRQVKILEPTVDHPHSGQSQVWVFPESFREKLAANPDREEPNPTSGLTGRRSEAHPPMDGGPLQDGANEGNEFNDGGDGATAPPLPQGKHTFIPAGDGSRCGNRGCGRTEEDLVHFGADSPLPGQQSFEEAAP